MPSPAETKPLDEGEFVWVEFDPVVGREQSGRRPALVLTNRDYHRISSLALVCPITSSTGPWPFKVLLPDGLTVRGAVLVDQIRSVDRASRIFKRLGSAPPDVMAAVRAKLAATLNLI